MQAHYFQMEIFYMIIDGATIKIIIIIIIHSYNMENIYHNFPGIIIVYLKWTGFWFN